MKSLIATCIVLAIALLIPCAKAQSISLLLKRNHKTMAKFYPGQSISLQTNGNTMVGVINEIVTDGIVVRPKRINPTMTAYGIPGKDTVFMETSQLSLASISAIYIPRRYKNDGVYFTERSQSATSVENISAQKGKQFYDTYWNTGEAGYIATAAVNTFLSKKKTKKPKGMKALGKRYRLYII
jgi:hypothetical protein